MQPLLGEADNFEGSGPEVLKKFSEKILKILRPFTEVLGHNRRFTNRNVQIYQSALTFHKFAIDKINWLKIWSDLIQRQRRTLLSLLSFF